MKKFFYTILIYAFLFTILACGLDYLISYRLRHTENNVLYNSWNDIYNRDFTANVVISGSSRAKGGYNPKIIDSILNINSYNLGIIGSLIDRQMEKYDIFCQRHGSPDYIIQNIDFRTMGVRNGYDREQFFPYFYYDREMMERFDQYEKFNLLEKYLPIYRYIGYSPLVKSALNIDNILYGYKDTDVWIKGYVGHKTKWDGSLFEKQVTILYDQDKQMIKKFESFLDSVTKRGAKVIFVFAPIYIGATEKIENIKGMYQMYDSIAQKRNIPILDYNYDKICYDTAYFYNAMHLNYKGSVLFSTKLANDLDSLDIIKSSNFVQ